MKVLTVAQNKGGTGKTTISRLIAEGLARAGLKVLAVDLDSQCNFSQRFLTMDWDPHADDGLLPPLHPDYDSADYPDWNGRSHSGQIYHQGGELIPYPTKVEGIDLIPGHPGMLKRAERIVDAEVKEKVHDRLYDFMRGDDVQSGGWDLAIIDTPPSTLPLTVSAVRAATHLIIPAVMEPQSIEGLRGMLQLWRREQRRRKEPLELIGVLSNRFRKGVALQEQLKQSLEADPNTGPLMMKVQLGQRTAFAESDHPEAKPGSVFDLPERSDARQEAQALVDEIKRGMQL